MNKLVDIFFWILTIIDGLIIGVALIAATIYGINHKKFDFGDDQYLKRRKRK